MCLVDHLRKTAGDIQKYLFSIHQLLKERGFVCNNMSILLNLQSILISVIKNTKTNALDDILRNVRTTLYGQAIKRAKCEFISKTC